MRRLLFLAALLFAMAAPAAPASAAPAAVGFGEQDPAIFSDARWQALQAPNVRLIIGWDALRYGWQRKELDDYVLAAQAAGANVLLGFGRSRQAGRRDVLPSTAQFRKEFLAYRKRYPSVREFVTWNEANHCSQPTCRKPAVVAGYYKAARTACRSCTILAASVLDQSNMTSWVKGFERAAKTRTPIWGLHNYLDANAFRTSGTKQMLRATKGKIWLTETGGIVDRPAGSQFKFKEGVKHAAKATNWLFAKLVPLSSRIQRVYVYHWRPASSRSNKWDSAVVDKRGKPRPAFAAVAKAVRKANAAKARRARP